MIGHSLKHDVLRHSPMIAIIERSRAHSGARCSGDKEVLETFNSALRLLADRMRCADGDDAVKNAQR